MLKLINFLLAVLAFVGVSEGFTVQSAPRNHAMLSSSSLRAWSIQMPDNFGKFQSTWYNEVDNPTARRPIYDE
jgi:hypothetical protein